MSTEDVGSALTTEKWVFADKELEILRAGPVAPVGTLVLVHGVCHGAWCWENFIRFFSDKGYQTVALSLRGHGASSGHRQLHRLRLADFVADVSDVIRKTGDKSVVIGHSMGGAIVQRYLAKYPETVSAAVLLASATAGGLGYSRFVDTLRGNRPASLWNAIRIAGGFPGRSPNANATPFFGNRLDPHSAEVYGERLGRESRRAVADLVRRFVALPHCLPPMMVVGSRSDDLFGEKSLRTTAQVYGVDPVVLDDMCHDMMLDPDWHVAAKCILDFLNSVGA